MSDRRKRVKQIPSPAGPPQFGGDGAAAVPLTAGGQVPTSFYPPRPAAAKDRPPSALRRARAEALWGYLNDLDGGGLLLGPDTYPELRDCLGLSAAQVDAAVEDLVAAGRAVLSTAGGVVVKLAPEQPPWPEEGGGKR
jgi:hypothetical protein